MCTTQQQPASKVQASKQSRSERKNTQRECVFLLSDADCSRPKEANSQKQYPLTVCTTQCRCRDARLEHPLNSKIKKT